MKSSVKTLVFDQQSMRMPGFHACPNEICVLWDTSAMLPTIPTLRGALRLVGNRGAVILTTPTHPDAKSHNAVEQSVSGLVHDIGIVPKRILFTGPAGADAWAIFLLAETPEDYDSATQTPSMKSPCVPRITKVV